MAIGQYAYERRCADRLFPCHATAQNKGSPPDIRQFGGDVRFVPAEDVGLTIQPSHRRGRAGVGGMGRTWAGGFEVYRAVPRVAMPITLESCSWV